MDSWGTETEASAMTSAITPAARQAFYVGVVNKVSTVLGNKIVAADMSEVSRSYQGGVMKIPFSAVDRVTTEQMNSIENELKYLNGSAWVENSDASGTQLIVTVDLKQALENGKRLQAMRRAGGPRGNASLLVMTMCVMFIAVVVYAFFKIPAQAKLDLVRKYIPAAESGFLRLAEMLRSAPAASQPVQ